jgi:predicted CopG family antitoxin
VNSSKDINYYSNQLPSHLIIVPKIESPQGIDNIEEIVGALSNDKKIIMLDHDDLYSALTKMGKPQSSFKDYFIKLIKFCNENNIILLRTVGVVFSDDKQSISDYVN